MFLCVKRNSGSYQCSPAVDSTIHTLVIVAFKALSKIVAGNFLLFLLCVYCLFVGFFLFCFFRESKTTFHVDHLLGRHVKLHFLL